MSYDGPDRRQKSEFEGQVLQFMARIDEHLVGQNARLRSHSDGISDLDARTTVLERNKEQVIGASKVVMWISSVPAVGTAAWFFVTWLKGISGGK